MRRPHERRAQTRQRQRRQCVREPTVGICYFYLARATNGAVTRYTCSMHVWNNYSMRIVLLFVACITILPQTITFAQPTPRPKLALSAEDRQLIRCGVPREAHASWNPDDTCVGRTIAQVKCALSKKSIGNAQDATGYQPLFAQKLHEFILAAEKSGKCKPGEMRPYSGIRSAQRQDTLAKRAGQKKRSHMVCQGGSACPHVQGRAADLMFGRTQSISKDQCTENKNPCCA